MAGYIPLAHGIYCLDAYYVHEQVAAIFLIRQANEVAIVETGTAHSISNVLGTLRELNIASSQVKYVIPTHVHLDHAGGASEMMKHFTQASLVVHPRGARHMINPEKLIAGSIEVYGAKKFNELYGEISPIPKERIIIADDLECLQLASRELLFIDTPGHARHHFCIYDQTSAGIFTGDTFGLSYGPMKNLQRGLIPTTPPVQFDAEALPRSIDRLMTYNPQRLYLTHYGEYLEPRRQQDSFKRWIDDYVDICRQIKPDDATAELALEQALTEIIMAQLNGGEDSQQIRVILKADIKLNAQGLAHWWRTAKSG